MWIEDLSPESDPPSVLVEESSLTRAQIDSVLRYRAAYPDEIEVRIELHRRETVVASTP